MSRPMDFKSIRCEHREPLIERSVIVRYRLPIAWVPLNGQAARARNLVASQGAVTKNVL